MAQRAEDHLSRGFLQQDALRDARSTGIRACKACYTSGTTEDSEQVLMTLITPNQEYKVIQDFYFQQCQFQYNDMHGSYKNDHCSHKYFCCYAVRMSYLSSSSSSFPPASSAYQCSESRYRCRKFSCFGQWRASS